MKNLRKINYFVDSGEPQDGQNVKKYQKEPYVIGLERATRFGTM